MKNPPGAAPAAQRTPTKPVMTKQGSGFSWLLVLLALLTVFAAHAQTVAPAIPAIDRATVYQKALPLYQYNAVQPLAVKIGEAHTLGNVKFQRFSYLSTNTQRIPALLFLPPGASAAHHVPCVVLLHGLGGSKEMMSGLGLFLATKGYASLAIDEYGQGERPHPIASRTQTQAKELATTVQQTAVDVRRGLDYLGTRPEIDSKRIGLTGISLGAIIGTVAAGVDTRIKATALISGGGDWGLILKTLAARNAVVGGRKTALFKNIDWAKLSVFLAPEDPLTFAPQIAPRPLLMLGGRKDTTIVPQAQQELFDAAQPPRAIVWYPQYGHVPPPEVVDPALVKFFAAQL
jgi:dienelactone hydrolase